MIIGSGSARVMILGLAVPRSPFKLLILCVMIRFQARITSIIMNFELAKQ